ncbi:hypothetical protein Bca101_100904 [Brassica carinata]
MSACLVQHDDAWVEPALVILASLHNLCIVRQGEEAVCWDLGCGKIMAVTRRNSVLLSTFVSGQKMTANSHMLVSKIKPCMFKKLVVEPWDGSPGPPSVSTGRLVSSVGDTHLALTGRDFDPIVLAGIGVMINRDSRGHSYFIVRGEILGFMKDEQLRKHLPRMFSLIKNESWGLKTIRYRPSLNHKRCRPGSADVAFRTPLAPYEKSKFLGSGGSMVARLKLKGIDGRAPPGVEPAA